jgi:hypothetical protein
MSVLKIHHTPGMFAKDKHTPGLCSCLIAWGARECREGRMYTWGGTREGGRERGERGEEGRERESTCFCRHTQIIP